MLYIHEGAYRSNFFYPNHFLSGSGLDYLRSDYKISLLQWLFFFQRITLNSTFIRTSLSKQQRFFFKFKKKKERKAHCNWSDNFQKVSEQQNTTNFLSPFSMFSINQHALQNEIKRNNEEQFHTSSSGTLKILLDKIIYRVKTWLINTPPHYIYLLRYHCASSKIHKTFAFIALEVCSY